MSEKKAKTAKLNRAEKLAILASIIRRDSRVFDIVQYGNVRLQSQRREGGDRLVIQLIISMAGSLKEIVVSVS
jgi:bifunctional ADP-heptose synthase (sugar kinase/adenylyltransferase)